VIRLSPDKHDDLVAQVSHLPHLLAAALAARVSDEALELAGGGFRDTTRIAAGSPDLWKDIIFANAPAISRHLDFLIRGLTILKNALETNSADAKSVLHANLKAGHDARLKLPAKNPRNS
jgi:prephenate dehydrogenase